MKSHRASPSLCMLTRNRENQLCGCHVAWQLLLVLSFGMTVLPVAIFA